MKTDNIKKYDFYIVSKSFDDDLNLHNLIEFCTGYLDTVSVMVIHALV